MAAAEIIGTAIGVMLLIIIAYILTGSTLISAETVANAQKDLTLLNEARLRTSISLSKSDIIYPVVPQDLYFNVTNNGNEVISDFVHIDIYTYNSTTSGFQYYSYDKYDLGNTGNWSIILFYNDFIHPNQLDPGEKMRVRVKFPGITPLGVQVVTNNGVYASVIV